MPLIQPVEIFKKSWHMFKTNWLAFGKITLWLLLPTALLAILNIFDEKTNLAFANRSIAVYLALTTLSFIISLWVDICLARMIWHALEQKPVELKTLRTEAWRDTASYLLVRVLVGLVVTLGLLLLVVPGVIFRVWFALAGYIFILEGVRGSAALRQSRALVEGRFWPIIWRWVVPFFLFYLILSLAVLVVALPVGFFTNADIFNWQNQPWWLTLWISVVGILTLPIYHTIGVIIYKNLKETKS